MKKKDSTTTLEFLSPYAPDAFAPETLKKVVFSKISFELTDDLWEEIDKAFAYYWNDEVGYGNIVFYNEACHSISDQLSKKNIIFSFDKICEILDILFDWIEQIPGAFLEESESEESQSFNKEFIDVQLNDFDNYDRQTNIVYISDLLKVKYKDTYKRLTKLFDALEIDWQEVPGTKDIWVRDFMPVQLHNREFVLYKYYPDYLDDEEYRKTITDPRHACEILGIKYTEKDILLDGGNITHCRNSFILTDKCLRKGADDREEDILILSNVLKSIPIIIPWHCEDIGDYEGDIYGHSDGFIRWCGGNKILMSNYREFHPEEAVKIRNILEREGYEVTEMLFDSVDNKHPEWNWAYINFLHVGDKIIVPIFGIKEDKIALAYIRNAYPYCIVESIRLRNIASNGGGLHCITWNIIKP